MALFVAAAASLSLPGCAVLGERPVAEAQLDAAQTVAIEAIETVPVSDLSALGSDYVPLGERLALLEVVDSEQLTALRRAAPALQVEPDLARGMLVGIISWLGAPVAGGGGAELADFKHSGGAALLAVRYRPGTYLPDGAATLAIGYVPTHARIAVVTVGNTRYYLDERERSLQP